MPNSLFLSFSVIAPPKWPKLWSVKLYSLTPPCRQADHHQSNVELDNETLILTLTVTSSEVITGETGDTQANVYRDKVRVMVRVRV